MDNWIVDWFSKTPCTLCCSLKNYKINNTKSLITEEFCSLNLIFTIWRSDAYCTQIMKKISWELQAPIRLPDCNTFSTGAEDFISSPGNKIMIKKGWEQFKEIILRLQKSVQDVLRNVVGRDILTLSPFIPGRPGGPGSPGKPKSPFGPCEETINVRWHAESDIYCKILAHVFISSFLSRCRISKQVQNCCQ